jgi:hypothetical protein
LIPGSIIIKLTFRIPDPSGNDTPKTALLSHFHIYQVISKRILHPNAAKYDLRLSDVKAGKL